MLTHYETMNAAQKAVMAYTESLGCDDSQSTANALFAMMIVCLGGIRGCADEAETLRCLDKLRQTVINTSKTVEDFDKHKH